MKEQNLPILRFIDDMNNEFLINDKCFYPAFLSFPLLKDLSFLLAKKLLPEPGFITVRVVKTHYEKGLSFEFTNFELDKEAFTKPTSLIFTVDLMPSWQVGSCFSHWYIPARNMEQIEEVISQVGEMQKEILDFGEIVRSRYENGEEDVTNDQYLRDRSWHTIVIE